MCYTATVTVPLNAGWREEARSPCTIIGLAETRSHTAPLAAALTRPGDLLRRRGLCRCASPGPTCRECLAALPVLPAVRPGDGAGEGIGAIHGKRGPYPVTVQGGVAAKSVELTGSAEAITMSALREFKIGKHFPPGNKTAPPRAPTT